MAKKRKRPPKKSRQQISKNLGERSLAFLKAVGFADIKASHESVYVGDKYFITQCPYLTPYDKYAEKPLGSKVDAVIVSGNDRIMVEVKYQNDTGTVDEKWPFIFACFAANASATEYVLLHDGEWWNRNRGAAIVKWGLAEAKAFEHRHGKKVHVINFEGWCEFVRFRFGMPQD